MGNTVRIGGAKMQQIEYYERDYLCETKRLEKKINELVDAINELQKIILTVCNTQKKEQKDER